HSQRPNDTSPGSPGYCSSARVAAYDVDGAPTLRMAKAPMEEPELKSCPTLPSRELIMATDARRLRRPLSFRFYSTENAALCLDMTAKALRQQCQRNARIDEHGRIVADLGNGFRAIKFRGKWLVKIPEI